MLCKRQEKRYYFPDTIKAESSEIRSLNYKADGQYHWLQNSSWNGKWYSVITWGGFVLSTCHTCTSSLQQKRGECLQTNAQSLKYLPSSGFCTSLTKTGNTTISVELVFFLIIFAQNKHLQPFYDSIIKKNIKQQKTSIPSRVSLDSYILRCRETWECASYFHCSTQCRHLL